MIFLSFHFAFEFHLTHFSPLPLSDHFSEVQHSICCRVLKRPSWGLFCLYLPNAATWDQPKGKLMDKYFFPLEWWGERCHEPLQIGKPVTLMGMCHLDMRPSDTHLFIQGKANGNQWFLSAMLFETRPAYSKKYSSKSLGGQSQRGCILQQCEARSFN